MKDLYRRIGLPGQTADLATLERAISQAAVADAKTAGAARKVLLNGDRKAVYDRTRAALLQIGQLRANLGIARAPNWLTSDCADFDRPPSTTRSQLQAFRARLHRPPDKQGLGIRGWIALGAGATVLASCFIGGVLEAISDTRPAVDPGHKPEAPFYAPPGASEEPSHSDEHQSRPVRATTRVDRVRGLVAKRYERLGLVADASTIDAAIEKLMMGNADATPPTGVLSVAHPGRGLAPLEIRTQPGQNYYVKVVEWATKAEAVTAFIRGGEHFETAIPLGSYEIKYATGESWYGPVLDFGERASYSRCEDRFDFTASINGYNGYTLELILQRNGNLDTDPIPAIDF